MVTAAANTVLYLAQRFTEFAKDSGWIAEDDPLVIDLDELRARSSGGRTRGETGIETRRASAANDNDAWPEQTFILNDVQMSLKAVGVMNIGEAA